MKKDQDITVFDKVRWHYPEGRNCPSLEAAKRHFKFILQFLQSHGLLSEDGKSLFPDGEMEDDFALTSDIVTPEGEALLEVCYDTWISQISYTGPLSDELLEQTLQRIDGKGGTSSMPAKPQDGKKKQTKEKRTEQKPSPLLYDRVDFHWPMAKDRGCKSLENAKVHLREIMRWLMEHNLLTEKGKAAIAGGDVADDFSLTGDLVTDKANVLLKQNYDRWLRNIGYGSDKAPTTKILDKALEKMQQTD